MEALEEYAERRANWLDENVSKDGYSVAYSGYYFRNKEDAVIFRLKFGI